MLLTLRIFLLLFTYLFPFSFAWLLNAMLLGQVVLHSVETLRKCQEIASAAVLGMRTSMFMDQIENMVNMTLHTLHIITDLK